MESNLFQIRVTGVLLEDGKILLVKQNVSDNRNWSLPGGRLEKGETLEQGVLREILEETGLVAKVIRLLYVCDKSDSNPPLLHITFLLERTSGEITIPSKFDQNIIHDVKMVPITELTRYGFSDRFKNLVENGFPGAGNYQGEKKNIGL